MQVEDVSAAELAARAEALAREPFDLAAGRPIRATLLRAGDERAELVLDVEQSSPPTPGESRKRLMHIPLAFGLVGPSGEDFTWDTAEGA